MPIFLSVRLFLMGNFQFKSIIKIGIIASRWSIKFYEGRDSIEDNPRSVLLKTMTNNANPVIVAMILDEDCRITVEQIVHSTPISTASLHHILTGLLEKRRVLVHLVLNIIPKFSDNFSNFIDFAKFL